MPAFTQNKAARLAQLDKEIIERFKEIQLLIKPGEERAAYYLSNLRNAEDTADIVAAAVGIPEVLAGLLVMHAESNPDILDAVPMAKEVIAKLKSR